MAALTKEERQIIAWLRGINSRYALSIADGIEQLKHRPERIGNGKPLGECAAK